MEKTVQSMKGLRALLLVTMVFLPLAVFACSGEEEVDPQEIFSEAIPAMKALDSFGFTYDVERPEGSAPLAGTDVAAIEGAVNAEGDMEARIDILQSGIPLQLNFVAAGDTHYVQNPLTGKWQSVAAEDSPVGRLNLGSGAIQILEKIENPSFEGSDEIEGVETYRLKGTVQAADVEGIAGAVSVDDPFPCEVWVGADDDLVRRITLSGAATSKEPAQTVRTIELTNFNEPVEIEPPQ
jgi:hypothetical protein